MSFQKILVLVLALILLCASLVACKGNDPVGAAVITPPTAISAEKQEDYTDDPTILEHVETLLASFEGVAENPASDFEWSESGGYVTVTKYIGSAVDVRVPAAIEGKTVNAIGDGAFSAKTDLNALYLPDSITRVGTGILKGCDALRALRTPQMSKFSDEIQYLGYLFHTPAADAESETPWRDNYLVPVSLKYLELGRMTALPDYALFDCNDLECISFSESVVSLGHYSMFQCERLLAVNVNGLTSVGDYAMANCRSLTRLDFSAQMISFGFGALEGCRELRRLTLPFVGGTKTENTYLGYVFGATVPEFSKHFYPQYLVELELLSGCETLGAHALWDCVSLTRVSLPESLTSIELRAFDGCVRLEAVTLPTSLSSLGENAFFDCHSLKTLTFAENCVLNSIGMNAFYNCVSLQSVTLPKALAALPASCFAGCTALGSIDLANVRSVGRNAFWGCAALKSVAASGAVEFAEGNDAATNCLPTK